MRFAPIHMQVSHFVVEPDEGGGMYVAVGYDRVGRRVGMTEPHFIAPAAVAAARRLWPLAKHDS